MRRPCNGVLDWSVAAIGRRPAGAATGRRAEVTGAAAAGTTIRGRAVGVTTIAGTAKAGTAIRGRAAVGTAVRRAAIRSETRGRSARSAMTTATAAGATRWWRGRAVEIGRGTVLVVAGASLIGVRGGILVGLVIKLCGNGMLRGLWAALGGGRVALATDVGVGGERRGGQQQTGGEGEFGFGLHGWRDLADTILQPDC
jgi:hypothetical protein